MKYKKTALHAWVITIVVGLLLLIGGCKDNGAGFIIGEAITFGSSLSSATRGVSHSQTDAEMGALFYPSMGIYASYGSTDWVPDQPWNLFVNQKVERTDGGNEWSYAPPKSMINGQMYSFFAYAPHGIGTITNHDTGGGIPIISYSVSDDHSAQCDLLIAVPQKNIGSQSNRITIPMKHALSRFTFLARAANPVNSTVRLKITAVELTNLLNTGSRSMDGSITNKWNLDGASIGHYRLNSTPNGGLSDTSLSASALRVITSIKGEKTDGSLFLMPQSTPDNAMLKVTFQSFNTSDGTPFDPPGIEENDIRTLTVKLNEIVDEWQAGEHIHFLLTIPNQSVAEAFEVEYQYKAWDDVSVEINSNPHPSLDISDLTTTTYDAAATRIFFYTKVTTGESVEIETAGVDADGIPFEVNNRFVSLAGVGALNLTHDNNTGKGYFDLINTPSVLGENSAKKSLIITLRAGKLHRQLTVTPKVSAFAALKDTTVYVGTFHRSNQTGERIVTWHTDESWSATINTAIGNHADLLIDRMVSPAMMDGSLYTGDAISPEGASVTDGGRTLSGSGRVYLRVGWRNAIPDSDNRYAAILVSFRKGGIDRSVTIYCRQGENPEMIVGNDEQFALYNIENPESFVEYPSQIGYLYQWNQTQPFSPITTGIPSDFVTQPINTPYNGNNFICPDKYAYPQQYEADQLKMAIGFNYIRQGYYADGYFDRRMVDPLRHQVGDNTTGNPVASSGFVLYNPANAKAIFLPSGAYRNHTGELTRTEQISGYWTEVSGDQIVPPQSDTDALGLLLKPAVKETDLTHYDKRHAFSVRCVKLQGTTVYFDPNGGMFPNRVRSITKPQPFVLVEGVPISPEEISFPSPINPTPDYAGRLFKGWKTTPDGKMPLIRFPIPTIDTHLYAHWVTPLIVNFRTAATENVSSIEIFIQPYLNPSSYYNKTALNSDANGNGATAAALNERAYPIVEFYDSVSDVPMGYAEAFSYCFNLEQAGKWRMPQISELISPIYYSVSLKGELFDGKELWSGTGTGAGHTNPYTHAYWMSNAPSYNNAAPKISTKYVRCVRELAIP